MPDGQILYGHDAGTYVFRLVGDVRQTAMGGVGCSTAFYQFIHELCASGQLEEAVFDCREAVGIDSTYLGLIAQVAVHVQETQGHRPVLISTRKRITNLLLGMGLDALFLLTDEGPETPAGDAPIPEASDQTNSAKMILDAHKTLAALNASNQAAFKDLIAILEQQSG